MKWDHTSARAFCPLFETLEARLLFSAAPRISENPLIATPLISDVIPNLPIKEPVQLSGPTFDGVLGSFKVPSTWIAPGRGDSVTIIWGDGVNPSGTPGTLVAGPAGDWSVLGRHTYNAPGQYLVQVRAYRVPVGTGPILPDYVILTAQFTLIMDVVSPTQAAVSHSGPPLAAAYSNTPIGADAALSTTDGLLDTGSMPLLS
jgi:hypothetical protein